MQKFLIICFLSTLFLGCNSEQSEQTNTEAVPISFDFKNSKQNIHSTGLIKDVEVISLSNDVLVGEVDKICSYNNYLYLLDAGSYSVYVYDNLGNFVNNIHDYGRAGNQYSQLVDILIDKKEKNLKLVSRLDRKLISYSLNGLDLLKIDRLLATFSNLSQTKNGFVGFTGNYIEDSNSKNVLTMNSNLIIENGFFDIDKAFDSYGTSSITPFSEYQGTVFFTKMMDYNIYSVGDNAAGVAYSFDFGEQSWPKEINSLAKMDGMSNAEKSKYIREIELFQETDDFLIIKVVYQGETLLGIYDKKNKESKVVTLDPYVDKYFISFGTIIGIDENAIYTLVDALNMKRFITGKDEYNNFEETYPEQIERLRNKFSHLKIDEQSNPFLVTYSLK